MDDMYVIRAKSERSASVYFESSSQQSRRDSIHKAEEVVSSIQYIQLLVVRKANGQKKNIESHPRPRALLIF